MGTSVSEIAELKIGDTTVYEWANWKTAVNKLQKAYDPKNPQHVALLVSDMSHAIMKINVFAAMVQDVNLDNLFQAPAFEVEKGVGA